MTVTTKGHRTRFPTALKYCSLAILVAGCSDGTVGERLKVPAKGNNGGAITTESTPQPSGNAATVDLSEEVTKESLRPYVGRLIHVNAFWSSRGKQSGYIHARALGGASIYVKATAQGDLPKQTELENRGKEGAPVEVTGVLRCYEPPGPESPDAQNPVNRQTPPEYFYFDVAKVTVAFSDGG
jgi:hypothetical protein